ncbi:Lrp/AsnC family transcriptional regulator [Candidatus Woesearchaeota archaeon]|nr:Lrp/AsnC family transcriptional regulator [Candidatus Woesearchaeota archaeon]
MVEKFSKFKGQINTKYAENKLDLINRKILYLLSHNARYGCNSIAKSLKISREVVAYRIKRMEEENFLEGFFSLIDVSKMGYQMHMLYLKLYNTSKYDEILRELDNNSHVTRLKELAGSYDLQLIVSSKNIHKTDEIIDDILGKFGDKIKDYIVLRIVEENYMGLDLLLTEEERKLVKIKESKGSSFQKEFEEREADNKTIEIDKKDNQILNIIHLDARASIKEISEKINLAPISVENRLKKLIKQGVIKSMYPLFNIGQLGYQWYKVLFQVKNINKIQFLEYLKQHDNVLWYMKLIGKWNYQFSVFAKGNAEFHKILDDIRNTFSDNIISYDSIIVLNQQKFVHLLS